MNSLIYTLNYFRKCLFGLVNGEVNMKDNAKITNIERERYQVLLITEAARKTN